MMCPDELSMDANISDNFRGRGVLHSPVRRQNFINAVEKACTQPGNSKITYQKVL